MVNSSEFGFLVNAKQKFDNGSSSIVTELDKEDFNSFNMGVGLGLGVILKFTDSLSMALGALLFWFAQYKAKKTNKSHYKQIVDNQEVISAGIIAGGSIIGIVLILIETALT